ncbi:MAG: thymidine phosphorylase [Balneolaceae bacterium]|nr:MAG: thymidine phosphorylase [Balneolaceae bacterium]
MASSSFNVVSLIRKKRDGNSLTESEIEQLIDAYTKDLIPDYQMSAFLMAAFLNGMNAGETAALTNSMLNSGIVVDLSHIDGIKVDKHSTGGVGDKTSLILAPIVAACGVPVPMISGRGLGHSGGTLDKLQSIPGFRVDMKLSRYKEIIEKHNLVLAGQTEEIAPADKRLYALRDVTATVEAIPLIASSIMSKKLAEGIDALVLDIKFGSGAFMKDQNDAIRLAETLVQIGEQFGKQTVGWLTSMEQPLGNAVGNWLEVKESIECLRGGGAEDLLEVTHLLAGTMIWLGGKAGTAEEGTELSRQAISNGTAFQKWLDIVEEQGGDSSVILNPETYPDAKFIENITSGQDGYVSGIDTYSIGMAALELGAGRKTKEETTDPQAGLLIHRKTGDYLKKGETIVTLYTNKKEEIPEITENIRQAYTLTESSPDPIDVITHRVDKEGVHEYRPKSL